VVDAVGEHASSALVAGVVAARAVTGATAWVERAAGARPADGAAVIASDQDAHLSTARAVARVIVQRDVAAVADRSEREKRVDWTGAAAARAGPWDAGRTALAAPLAGVVAMPRTVTAALAAGGSGPGGIAAFAEVGLAVPAAAGHDPNPVAASAARAGPVIAAVAVDAEGPVAADEDDSADPFAAGVGALGRGPTAGIEGATVAETGDDGPVALASGAGLDSGRIIAVAGVADPTFRPASSNTSVRSPAARAIIEVALGPAGLTNPATGADPWKVSGLLAAADTSGQHDRITSDGEQTKQPSASSRSPIPPVARAAAKISSSSRSSRSAIEDSSAVRITVCRCWVCSRRQVSRVFCEVTTGGGDGWWCVELLERAGARCRCRSCGPWR
jgi:hypothetical protein